MPDPSRRLLVQPPARSRRDFLRRAAGVSIAALGGPLLIPDDAWAGIEERAAQLGITPGTVVDAQGRPMESGGSDPFIAEVMMFAGNFAPRNWALCDGQLLQISQNTALFSLIGTTYGGDGRTTMGLPNLQGRMPMHNGRGPGLTPRRLGETGGAAAVALTAVQIPSHTHGLSGSSSRATGVNPSNGVPALPTSSIPAYADTGTAALASTGSTGNGDPHNNLPPYLVVNFIISLGGTYPSRA